MRQLLIFVVESKSDKENSDGIYLKETLNYFYDFNQKDTIIKFVYMNGKQNYNKRKVEQKVLHFIKHAKAMINNIQYKVFYVFDKDNVNLSSEDIIFNKKVTQYCQKNNYCIIWMNKNVEDVYLRKTLEHGKKVKEAGQFKKRNAITKVNVNHLMNPSANSRHSSNIFVELDKILIRKKN